MLALNTTEIEELQRKLPPSWRLQPLEEVCEINPRRPRIERQPEQLTSFLPMAGVNDIEGSIDSLEIRQYQEVARGYTYFEEEDVLFAKITPCMENGKSAIARNLVDGIGFGSTEFHVLRPGPDVLPEWIYRFVRRLSFRQEAQKHFKGAVGQQRVPSDFVKLSLIPVPPTLDIQQRIIARVEALLAEVRSSRELLDEMRRDCDRLLAVTVNDAFNKLESMAEIVPLATVATAFNGRAVGEGTSNIRVFKSKHVYPHSLKMDRPSYMKEDQAQKMPEDRFLKPGDVLMANAAEGTLGRVSYVDKCEENWTVDGKIMILRSRDQQDLSSKWLYYYLWSDRGNREVLSRRTGTAFAENRGQTGISPTSVLEIPVPKPSINAQNQVVNYLDSVLDESEAMIKLMDQDAKTLDQLEQAILERAFRGEL
ncbi:restriction endonuclease subunit S [Phormidium tenue FACHB-886]|nr:restriction endonuclease subunit S [Phormidium tenue FACHB-886]